MITIEQIEEDLQKYGLELRSSHQGSSGYHVLSTALTSGENQEQNIMRNLAVTIMGVRFQYKCCIHDPDYPHERRALYIFKCSFSCNVLLNSIGVTFECTK